MITDEHFRINSIISPPMLTHYKPIHWAIQILSLNAANAIYNGFRVALSLGRYKENPLIWETFTYWNINLNVVNLKNI